jgi:hypothetical protein
MNQKSVIFGSLAVVAIIAAAGFGAYRYFSAPTEPKVAGAPATMRRLTEAQYRRAVTDTFGNDIRIAGRFEPEARRDGLLAVGSSQIGLSATGFEQYYNLARDIAAQVVAEPHRASLPCKPKADNTPDDACTATVLRRYGLSLFRRPPTDARLSELVTVANKTTEEHRDFYAGLRMALVGLLAAPDFLFRVDLVTMAHPGQPTLDDYSKAARLSYFLWDAEPDAELLAAAAQGDLDSRSGLARQVDRLIASPRLDDGARAFFTDFLGFDEFAHLEKDGAVYPAFNPLVAKDAEEQTLKTVTDLLLARDGDYRDLFTNRDTFMTRRLGLVYGVPVESKTGWDRFHFPNDDPRGGLLTQASFTALHSHPGRSSPTLRGKAIRELLLCQPVPAPPNNVNFAVVQDTSNPNFKTARDRLTAHRTEPTCAGCHRIVDPAGLALENFDGAGQFRPTENGAAIDASGDLDGQHFTDADGLGRALHDDPAASACLVTSVYRYAVGRSVVPGERDWMKWLTKNFTDDGYRLPDLMHRIALSRAFYAVSEPSPGTKSVAALPRTGSEEARK